MVKCTNCRQRFIFEEGKWIEFNPVRRQITLASQQANIWMNVLADRVKTTGEILKELGVSRFKKEKIVQNKESLEIVFPKKEILDEKKRIEAKWHNYLPVLNCYGNIIFSNGEHFGKLRGKHIAKAFHRDCKKMGLNTRIDYANGKVELVR